MSDNRADTITDSGNPNQDLDAERELVQAQAAPDHDLTPEAPVGEFPIVGIGASAGGLTAFEDFFTHMPPDSGMAFVLVQHVRASHKNLLVNLIAHYTQMAVAEVEDGVTVKPNCVYIIPSASDIALLHGRLQLLDTTAQDAPHLPIDFFFRSLAQDKGDRAVCIVLSGTGSDGTVGLKAVKEAGGMAMAQAPESAEYDGMPRSAIATDLVDYVLPPAKMPSQLLAYVGHAFRGGPAAAETPSDTEDALRKVYILLRSQLGHDFSYYRESTIRRRIARRMAIKQIPDLDAYVRLLQQDTLEVATLFKEMLISVTNFFRDPEAFEALAEEVIPELLERPRDMPIRVWVPGCATGEEAYSIAILLREAMAEKGVAFRVQIFASDIDSAAIETARIGRYPEGIAADISPERLVRYFDNEEGAYRVNRTLREMLTFAEQNVIADPPFSRVDLITCRNLLIYMTTELQARVLPLFHFALQPRGFLVLGTSESVGKLTDLFEPVDRTAKIFRRLEVPAAQRQGVAVPFLAQWTAPAVSDASAVAAAASEATVRELAEKALLEHFAPACAIVNHNGDILYFYGRTGNYLEPAPGRAALNILQMAREGIRAELTAALYLARNQRERVRYENLEVMTDGDSRRVDLTVWPLETQAAGRRLLMVTFEDAPAAEVDPAATTGKPIEDGRLHVAQLEHKLRVSEERLRATVEELQSSNEELRSSNEELQSSNEELQSSNEELETSQEELQSINEELITANAELQETNGALTAANDDLQNFLTATGVATVFLDGQLKVRRFTPAASKLVNLIPADVGRPLEHISARLVDSGALVRDAEEVLDTLMSQEKTVRTLDGESYLLRIQPYRTLQNVIQGVVLTFVNITSLDQARTEITDLKNYGLVVEAARDYAESILATIRQPLVILDGNLRVSTANRAFYDSFQVIPEETERQAIYDLGNGQWDIPELKQLLEEILPQQTSVNDYIVNHTFPALGPRTMILNARKLRQAEGHSELIFLAIEDVTATSQRSNGTGDATASLDSDGGDDDRTR